MICQYCGATIWDDLLHLAHCDGRQGKREAALAALEPVPPSREPPPPPPVPPVPDIGDPPPDDEPPLPLLMSGLTADTYATSRAAAVQVLESKDTQRALVEGAIVAAWRVGHTDDQIQIELGLDGSSERPRRWELWKQGRIRVLRDAAGRAVRRLTRTGRRAVVWVSVDVPDDPAGAA